MSLKNLAGIRTLAVVTAVTALTLVSAGVANAKPGGVPAIPLNTAQETTGSNTGASGFFSYEIDGNQLCYTMTARNLSVPATAAHVHVAPRNTPGPVVIALTVGTGTSWNVQGCASADPALLAEIEQNPRGYYINVHTPTFPGGEVRGQLK